MTVGAIGGVLGAIGGTLVGLPGEQWTPASLPGLWLWAENSGLAAGSLPEWVSQVGPSFAATGTPPTVLDAATPSGGRAVRFANTNPMRISSGVMVTASSSYPGWDVSKLIDGTLIAVDAASWSAAANAPGWVEVSGPATVVSEYKILARTSAATSAPGAWTLEGSQDGGATWDVLDSRSGVTFTGGQLLTFAFSNTVAYSKYRLNITATGGAAWPSFSELVLTGLTPTPAAHSEVWAVLRADGTGYNGLWSWNSGAGSFAHTLYGPSHFYETFGVAAANTSQGSGASLVNWHIYRVTNDGTTLATYRNGVLLNSLSVASQGGASWAALPWLGRTVYGGTQQFGFTGTVAEMIVTDAPLNVGDADALLAHLAAKHGISV